MQLNFLHRFLARVVVIAINIHGFGYSEFIPSSSFIQYNFNHAIVYKWLLESVFMETIAKPRFYWGLIGMICFDCLFFFSTAWWRQNAYNVFLGTHIVSFSLLFPAVRTIPVLSVRFITEYFHRCGCIMMRCTLTSMPVSLY